MDTFSKRAKEWDLNPTHKNRSEAIAKNLQSRVALSTNMKAMEFGAGTGILSFLLADQLGEIHMMDTAQGMVEVMQEKIVQGPHKHLIPVYHDLTVTDYNVHAFDLIFSQMVFHHIHDIGALLARFYKMLNVNGIVAVADLFKEDGSFHGDGFDGHLGFDADDLQRKFLNAGFKSVQTEQCYSIQKDTPSGLKDYPIFQMIAYK